MLRRVYEAMAGEVPGEPVRSSFRDGEGPVLTRTPDGSLHLSYVVLTAEPTAEGEAAITGARVLYQESFEDPIAAGAEFQHVEDHLPKMPRQRTFASARELVEFKRENQEADRRFEVEMAEVNREVFGG